MRIYSEIVPYDLAIQTTDAGFNWDTDYFYRREDQKRISYNTFLSDLCCGYKEDQYVFAPYYSEILDWLYVNKGLIINITPDGERFNGEIYKVKSDEPAFSINTPREISELLDNLITTAFAMFKK